MAQFNVGLIHPIVQKLDDLNVDLLREHSNSYLLALNSEVPCGLGSMVVIGKTKPYERFRDYLELSGPRLTAYEPPKRTNPPIHRIFDCDFVRDGVDSFPIPLSGMAIYTFQSESEAQEVMRILEDGLQNLVINKK